MPYKNKADLIARRKQRYKERKEEFNSKHMEYYRTPKGAFHTSKSAAKSRGIEFLLTFEEWWSYWEGLYDQRGVNSDSLCMCRTNDEGAYEVGNVRIDTVSSNLKEMQNLRRQNV
tara:strand:- start:43 stop:387 length:345 start_codon:yes stop_codon:yes gene_type:complete